MKTKVYTFIIPRHMVERLGANLAPGHPAGFHAGGGAVLDGFLGHDGEPIDSHPGADEGDYVVRPQDLKRGPPNKAIKHLHRLLKEHGS